MSSSSLKIFVTGGSGFIGGYAVQALLDRGHQVLTLDHSGGALPPGCRSIKGDLLDVAGFVDALTGCAAVLHAAAVLHPVADANDADQINRHATVELARAAAEHGVGRFVFLSSYAAIGIRDLPEGVDTEVSCLPELQGAYGVSKRRAEVELLALDLHDAETSIAIVRPPLVYGRGEHRNFLELVRAIDTGLFVIPGRGENKMSFCHAVNLARALLLLLERPDAHGIFHAADAAPVTLRGAVEVIARHLNRRLLPLPFPMPLARGVAALCELAARPLDVTPPLSRSRLQTLTSNFALDCSALTQLGYRPSVTFDSGVAETIEWYRSQGLMTR